MSPRLVLPVRLLVALLCAAGVVASLVAHHSEVLAADAVHDLPFAARAEATRHKLEDAKKLNPDTRIDSEIAITYSVQGRSRRADATMRDAVRKEPDNVALWVLWTKIHVEAGDRAAAQRTYARARALNPSLPR